MASCSGINLTMDLTRYFRLPPDVRVRFDGWLKAEHLVERMVIRLTLGEGAVTIERFATDSAGRPVVESAAGPVRITETIAVMTLPPQEVWEY